MNDLGEPLRVPGDQNGAVAIQRIFFSAKQGDAMVLKPFLKPLQTFGECGSGSDEIVGNGVFNVALAFIAARTEFPAKENVMDPSGFKRKLKRLFGKTWKMAAVGPRADIGDRLDLMLKQELKEPFDGMRRMSDGKERVHDNSMIAAAILY